MPSGHLSCGEEKIVYKTVRKSYSSSSTSDTDSDSDSEKNEKKKCSKKKMSVSSANIPQNIVYKHRKTIFWITDNTQNTNKTIVSFFTTRKAATKCFSKLMKKKGINFIFTLPSAHFSFLNNNQCETHSVNVLPQTPQWHLLVNESWRYLGWELSSALEVAFQKGFQGYTFGQYFKV